MRPVGALTRAFVTRTISHSVLASAIHADMLEFAEIVGATGGAVEIFARGDGSPIGISGTSEVSGSTVDLDTADQIPEDRVVRGPRYGMESTPFTKHNIKRDHGFESIDHKEGVDFLGIKKELVPIKLEVAFLGRTAEIEEMSKAVHGDHPLQNRGNLFRRFG